MKETEIAKENVEVWKEMLERCQGRNLFRVKANKLEVFMQSHKQTCQRWLEFLEKLFSLRMVEMSNKGEIIQRYSLEEAIGNKIKDLKQAIKLYTENSI